MARSPAPSRAGRVAITAHLPGEVRNRLQKLASDLERTKNDLIA
jgi:predicted DNA-binding protein